MKVQNAFWPHVEFARDRFQALLGQFAGIETLWQVLADILVSPPPGRRQGRCGLRTSIVQPVALTNAWGLKNSLPLPVVTEWMQDRCGRINLSIARMTVKLS
ncbi:MAG: hypothetical protein JNJ55_09250 [Betaproteobacteria bacterium]|nr:hypothetical protein [Betaproteobacteria bacterium]